MKKIQYKILLIFLIMLGFIIISLVVMHNSTHQNSIMLLQEAEKRQTELLTVADKTLFNSLVQFAYDYTYWDEMVRFVSIQDKEWSEVNIESSAASFGSSVIWIFNTDFKQVYGFECINESSLEHSFIETEDLKNLLSKQWFAEFWMNHDGSIYHLYGAPIQPSADTERKTAPKGWLIVARRYDDNLLKHISIITNSDIKIVSPEKIKNYQDNISEHNAGVFAFLPIRDPNQRLIAYLTSFHIDKATEKFINSTHSSIPAVAMISTIFFGTVLIVLIFFVVRPVNVLSKSLNAEDESLLIPLLAKRNEFGDISRMMDKFFVQKKHLELEIKIRTETEVELKQIQSNLEFLVESRTAELKEANDQMQIERDQAKLYLDMAGAVICLLDQKANIMLANKMGYKLLGFNVGELIGKNWMDFCADDNVAASCALKFNSILIGETDSCGDYVFNLKTLSGQVRQLLINSRVTINPINGSRAVLFSGVDITDIKRTEDNLKKAIITAENANKAQAAFFANMSHELRTPLFGILGYSDLMVNGDYGEEVKHMASTINKGGKRLIETLNKVLNLSKLKADKYELNFSEADICSLINETVNLFQVEAASKGLNIIFNQPSIKIISYTDTTVIRDILSNLIHNAIKFTFYGSITVSLESNNGSFIIKVKDTGIGIPEESLKLIFEEFRQVSEGYARSFEGTGLGLAILKKYVDLLKGKIELMSKINYGSEFIISLPINDKEIVYANSK